MNIMDMTLRQILAALPHHITWMLFIVSVVLNFEAIVRQVAVNRGYKNVVSLCDRIAGFFGFIIDVFEAYVKKQPPKGPDAVPVSPSALKAAVLCIVLAFGATGCASAGLNGGCMHVNGVGSYATVSGDLHGCICHAGCLGFGCKNPDYTALATMYSTCEDSAKSVTTTIPITVGVVPIAK